MKKIAVLTGAGISAESGISTFRDSKGLWEGHDVMEVASPQGWNKDLELVLEFYNLRRRQLLGVQPNQGHLALVELEKHFEVTIITQNVDDLHERAGSKKILHLHGELLKARSLKNDQKIYDHSGDIKKGDLAPDGGQLRPHIVWFGEAVPMISYAESIVAQADILLIVGTSLQVYPAAGLVGCLPIGSPIYYIDPRPSTSYELKNSSNLTVIENNATKGIPDLVQQLTSDVKS